MSGQDFPGLDCDQRFIVAIPRVKVRRRVVVVVHRYDDPKKPTNFWHVAAAESSPGLAQLQRRASVQRVHWKLMFGLSHLLRLLHVDAKRFPRRSCRDKRAAPPQYRIRSVCSSGHVRSMNPWAISLLSDYCRSATMFNATAWRLPGSCAQPSARRCGGDFRAASS